MTLAGVVHYCPTCSTTVEKNSQINNTITKPFKGHSRIRSFLKNSIKWIINFITKTDDVSVYALFFLHLEKL